MSKGVLSKPRRVQLENTVKLAREVAESAAHAALYQLGVSEGRVPGYLTEEQKALRRRLRAHGRALGDTLRSDDSQTTQHLVWEVAYEHWHRMLFARFLAENYLLMWEPGAPVTLAECDELAQDPATSRGTKSGWELAAKLASRMLPQVFKPASPVFDLSFAPEHQRQLERLLVGLPEEAFRASDSLGWVYQFWQAKRKDEVNASEVKIGADELPAVTQLFTEPYMVEFLLHNSLGAWWVTRFPDKACPVELTYLRRLDDGTPAAGKFEGWPNQLSDFKLLDPCCGSGHFLVAAFLMLVPMRMAAEGLSAEAAVDVVLADNVYGLELDPRCVEIAVFALALAAWRYTDEGGHPLGVRAHMPSPHIACCGLKVAARPQDWEALVPSARADATWLRQEMRAVHSGFAQAPLLGSLLDPSRFLKQDLATPDVDALREFLTEGLIREEQDKLDGAAPGEIDDAWDIAVSAHGLLDTARTLVGRYHLVITNVPYLTRGRQSDPLKAYCERHYPTAKNDLANVFLERCLELATAGSAGVVQVVMPQNWLFLGSYKNQREQLLRGVTWNFLARLGEGGFDSPQAAGAFTILLTLTSISMPVDFNLIGLDASGTQTASEKAGLLQGAPLVALSQKNQLSNPDARVALVEVDRNGLLNDRASSVEGLSTGDSARFLAQFWETRWRSESGWEPFIQSVDSTVLFGGRSEVIRWQNGQGALHAFKSAHNFPSEYMNRRKILGKHGIRVTQMRGLPCTIYTGEVFGKNGATVVPHDEADLPALWCFVTSPEYCDAVRKIDQSLKVTVGNLIKVRFERDHWARVAAERYPDGLPHPHSDDPTQWIFHGHPRSSTAPLQVAVGRLVDYSWPAESDKDLSLSDEAHTWVAACRSLEGYRDDDGIVCLNPVRGERSAHERLLALLIDAWETVEPGSWKNSVLDRLLDEADCSGKGLDVWLRDKFFEQHAKLFHHRPFIWHIWDGLEDGFGALVNYHKLDAKKLERLIHTYLGDWIRTQEAGLATGVDGAQQRLAAALLLKVKLEAILEGEAPYDIFVRWKPIDEQPIGWNPDMNDGVRLNIRPFMTADLLRHNKPPKLNIKWDKDKGKDVNSAPWFSVFGGDRINNHHLTLAEKRAARENKK